MSKSLNTISVSSKSNKKTVLGFCRGDVGGEGSEGSDGWNLPTEGDEQKTERGCATESAQPSMDVNG